MPSLRPAWACLGKLFPGLGFLGRYRHGRPVGVVWQQLVGGAWLYGQVI